MFFSLLIYLPLIIILFFISFKISNQFDLKDFPTDNKLHLKPVSYLGGVTISISLIILYYFYLQNIFLS